MFVTTDALKTEYDLVVVGGSPGGVAAAVRAARSNLAVLLVSHSTQLGGMMSGGLGRTDTIYVGRRGTLWDEIVDGIDRYYTKTYGPDSEQRRVCRPRSHCRLNYEPAAAHHAFAQLVQAESSLQVLAGYYVQAVRRAGRRVEGVMLRALEGNDHVETRARFFVDATYEGDLAALAGVAFRVGREGRAEHQEPHAGKLFVPDKAPGREVLHHPKGLHGPFHIGPSQHHSHECLEGSTGEGDALVQAYHYRAALTDDPGNRRMPVQPGDYDRERLAQEMGTPHGQKILARFHTEKYSHPNRKILFGNGNLVGGAHDYPLADWSTRREIARRHWDYVEGLLYFAQNDASIPEADRRQAQRWGFAKDEFGPNGELQYELYVREARRIIGRYLFTQHDAMLAPGLGRTPIHHDSIGFAEWMMDSHETSRAHVPGSHGEGKFILSELTRPSQIPYRALIPKEIDNLIVPVCLSATHVGWGTLRLEPVWMHVGDAAGHALALAADRGVDPAHVKTADLQQRLVEAGAMITFFADCDVTRGGANVAAIQFLGTKGFFPDYEARPSEPLDPATAAGWAESLSGLAGEVGEVHERARALRRRKSNGRQEGVGAQTLRALIDREITYHRLDLPGAAILQELNGPEWVDRGRAAQVFYKLVTG